MMLRQRHQPTGFTLLEVLLALAAFGILSVTVIAVFMSSGREERRGLARQREVGSAQFIMEQMAKDIRLGTPDYEYYADRSIALATGSAVNAVHRLAVRFADGSFRTYGCWAQYQIYDPTGTPFGAPTWTWCESPPSVSPGFTVQMLKATIISQSPDTCGGSALPPCTDPPVPCPLCTGTPISWSPASLQNAVVRDFQVYITPPTDPFPLSATDLRQPLTTVVLTTEGTGRSEEQVRTTFQTTASSRTYAR